MSPLATIDRGSGRPVVFLHGQPGTGAVWEPVLQRLPDRFRALAPDRPGHGATPGEAAGMAANADAVADLLVDRGAAPATVVGHSWSGGVALLLADRHPEVVRSLVLVGAVGAPDSVNWVDRLLVVPGLADVLTVLSLVGMGEVLPRVRRWVVGSEGDGDGTVVDGTARPAGAPVADGSGRPGVRRRLAAALPDESLPGGWTAGWGRERRTFVAEQRALLAELPGITAVLGSVRVPTTVVVGQWDVVVPPASGTTLAAAIPEAELITVPEVGHFLPRDVPDRLVSAIEATDGRAEVRSAG